MRISRATQIKSTVVFAVLSLAIVLRVLDFPTHYEHRDMDETGYCAGSLQLLEGITPGYKAAPAGPLFWLGWMWAGGETIYDLAHPLPDERQESLALRPLTALNRVLFDNYRDISSMHRFLVIVNLSVAVLATLAATGLGIRLGGPLGGFILGGLFAGVPIFLDLSEMSRPYSMAWSFGIIALFFAAENNPVRPRRRWVLTAVFLGLSIGSRIEMLCLMPLVWWIFWERPGGGKLIVAVTKVTALSLVVATWVAPWLVTQLIGNLRTIATVRIGGPPGGTPVWAAALFKFFIEQGMAFVILLAIAGLFFQPRGTRIRRVMLGIYAMFLLASVLSFSYGMHQHGAVFIAWFVLIAAVLEPIRLRWPRFILIAGILVVLFPLTQTILDIRSTRAANDFEESVAWIEQHVPAGTTVYMLDGGMPTLLPTQESATSLWAEVNDDQAWKKKMESGVQRFNLNVGELPRALGEENLTQERGNRRKWFILGGRADLQIPRYDIRIVKSSPVFGIQINDLPAALRSRGGILVWRDEYNLAHPDLGVPLVQWLNRKGTGVSIYCTSDVRASIK